MAVGWVVDKTEGRKCGNSSKGVKHTATARSDEEPRLQNVRQALFFLFTAPAVSFGSAGLCVGGIRIPRWGSRLYLRVDEFPEGP